MSATIEDLPDELLEHILGIVSPYKDLDYCKLVSRKWNHAMKRMWCVYVHLIYYDCFVFQASFTGKSVTWLMRYLAIIWHGSLGVVRGFRCATHMLHVTMVCEQKNHFQVIIFN